MAKDNGHKKDLKYSELKLITELMKNSRRSDRELAKTIGVSQPTANRLIKNLKKEGVIKEFTMIPDFRKLGFELIVATLVKLEKPLSSEEIEKAKKLIEQTLKILPIPVVMLERGIGIDSEGLIISYHKDYSSLREFLDLLRQTGLLDVHDIRNFIVSLRDAVHFIPFTFSVIGDYVSRMGEMEKGVKP